MSRIKLVMFFILCPLTLAKAEIPKSFTELVAKTGLKEGEYKTVGTPSDQCAGLELRFFYPEDKSLTIMNGATPLFLNVGNSETTTERGCKRTVESKVEQNKITQNITVQCKKQGNHFFQTISKLTGNKLEVQRLVKKEDQVTEQSTCQYTYAKSP